MHDAYELIQLLKLSQQQIDSIAAYDDNLLVGTRQGLLLMYGICCREGDQKHEVELLRYTKTFSKKPIQQLEVIPEYQLLVSLSDNIICVHDMTIYNFPVVTKVERSRGATLFVLDIKRFKSLTGESSVTVRMCVAVKRKLQMYYWKNNKFLDMCDDFTIPDIPKALAWCDETICVGFKGDYCLVQLTGVVQDLFPTGKQEPIITKLSDNTFALGKDSQSILMNTKGDPTHKYAIKWSEIPTDVSYDEPYLVAILSDCVEIRTIEPQLFVQTLPVPKPRLVCRCERQGRVYVASATHVWCLQSVPLDRQIHVLLQERQFQLALKLTNISKESDEEKKKNVHEIQKLYAFHLFNNKQFKDSMKEFLKLEIDPYEVIRLFPDLLPQQSRNSQDIDSRPKLQDRELENGLLALIEFLTEVRHKLMKDTKNRNCNTNNSNSIQDKTTQQLLQIIDTTLLKCYLQTNDALVAPLLRLNHCHLHETEKTLKKYQKYSELIILYQTKGLHRKALELLQKQADQPDSTLHGFERTLQYLQHLGKDNINLIFDFAGWILDSHPEEGLKMFTEDIMEVEQLPRPKVLDYLLRTHKNLVIPYLEHVVNVWKDTNPIFHNALVHQYRERSQQLLSPTATPSEHEEGQKMRCKLLGFLQQSSHYTPETVLVHFPYDCLFEERAIVLGKLGRHEQALSIYVSILGDVSRAIDYCDKVYEQKSEGCDEVYVILIKMLINPPDNWLMGVQPPPTVQPDLETALKLFEEHATKIHPVKALSVLPDKVPLVRIKHFLETSLHNKLNERRRTQVLKGLLYAEHLQVQELRIHYESQSISMTEFNVCPVCKKRFGNQSAFARYPNGDIVHYSCQDRRT
ncbi:vam6/Vps39-like protein [Anabrus simplex]|uniref:vam6/Vps39-like protein n=1 Tax=Anabrus simplex TaxID=316456 RepID=UPI0034DD7914